MTTPSATELDRRRATVMFVDILGATELTAQAGIEQTYAIVTGCLRVLDGIARRHGGVVDKYLSDCLMAVFGVPIASAESPIAAVAAAAEMLEAAARYGAEVESPLPLTLRIGINTGLMVAGDLRGPVVREFAVMGDAVNVAARLKDVGEPGGIHVGPETHDAARLRFDFEAGEPLPLRGKIERVPAFRFVAVRPGGRRIAGGRSALVETPLIGRESERARLRDALTRVCADRRGRTIVVRGDEGAGKSRLATDLCAAAREAGATVLTAHAVAAHRETPFFLAAELISDWAGVGVADGTDTVRAKVVDAAVDVPGLDAAALGEALTTVPSAMRDATLAAHALEMALAARAARVPLVVVCEDLQWADGASLDLIVRLAGAPTYGAVLWLLTTRTDAALGCPDDVFELPPLAPEDAVRLVDHVTGGATLSAVARERIEHRAGGNPARLILGGLLAGAVETEVAHEAATVERASDTERRRVTVLFADITGFTSMSEKLPPAESYRAVSGCLAILHEVAEKHGGSVDKYLGDCIMAVFGAPVAIEDAPRAAVNAAIEMRRRVREYNRTAALPTPLDIHVGINTGLGVAGDVSGPLLREFTLMGEAVSLASKLKDKAPAGRIWVGAETHRATRGHFAYAAASMGTPPRRRRLGGLWSAGEEDRSAVTTWELQSEREQIHRDRPDDKGRSLFSALVGREAESTDLRERFDALRRGVGGVVSIVGEAGIGKSRLVHEVAGPAARDGFSFLEGRSLAMGANLRFHPFVDLLRQWAGIGDDEEAAAATSKLRRSLEAVLGNDAQETFPFIATLAGLRLDEAESARLQGMGGDVLERLITKHVRELLVALCHARPHVVFIEDLHWADQSSIKLLISLLPLTREHALFIVLAYRPDHERTSGLVLQELTARFAATHGLLRLAPLEQRQTLQLLQNLLSDRTTHPAWNRLLAKAAGNPFFVEEVVRALIEQGAVVRTTRGYEVTDQIETIVVPATVEEVVMARVDRLPGAARQLLQLASVVGRRAPYRLLEAVAPEPAQLAFGLASLANVDLLVEERAGDDATWTFVHALAHEAVYASMLVSTRKALHLRVAGAIEQLFEDRLGDFHGPLAFHYTRGEQLDKAEEYLLKAGEDAARAAASDEALALFREASRVFIARHGDGGDRGMKGRLEKNIALALLNRGDLSESIAHFDRALEHFGERVPKPGALSYLTFGMDFIAIIFQLYLGMRRQRTVTDWGRERDVWQMIFNRGRAEITSDPMRLFFDTIAAFRQLNRIDASRVDQGGALYASCASVFCYSGISFAVSRRALAIARQVARPDSSQDGFTCAVMDFTVGYLEGGWANAPVIDAAQLDEALRNGQLWDANTYLGLRCDQLLRCGDFVGAQAQLDRLAVLRDAYNYGFAGGNHDGMRAVLLAEGRQLDEALVVIEEYLAGRHEDPLRAFGLGTKAKIQTLRGQLMDAEQCLAEAIALLERSPTIPPWHRSAVAAARLRLVAARLEAGDGSARRVAKSAIHYGRRVARLVAIQRAEIQQLIGRVHQALGERRAALRAWRDSLAVAEAMGARPELARTQATLAMTLADDRLDGCDAAAYRARAAESFAALGLAWDLMQLRGIDRAA